MIRKFFLLLGVLLSLSFIQPTQAQNITIFTGFIDSNTPFVEYPVQVTHAGTTLTLDLRKTSGNLDTLLYLVDSNGNIIGENDDRARGNTDSRIVFPQAARGNYTAIATRFGVASGTSSGDYELLISLDVATTQTEAPYRVSDDDLRNAGFVDIAVRPRAEWTIVAYYGGDNNLEPGLQFDFNEFELAGGSNQNVRIIMLFDRSPEHSDANGNWSGVRVYEIGPDLSNDSLFTFPPTLDSTPLFEMGQRDSSDGEFYAQYVVWALRHFPANHYAFALASHGAGWKGIITDDTTRAQTGRTDTILTLPELRQALSLAKQTAGVDKFNLLINDACSMASVEYFGVMANYFTYALASPEIVIDPALDMTLFTARLNQELANANLPNLGVNLVDKYINLDMRQSGDADVEYFTHSLFNLNNYDPVIVAIEAFARVFNANPSAYANMLGQARANTYTYTAFAGSSTKIDAGSLMREVLRLSRDPQLIAAANAVLEALAGALVYGNAGNNVKGKINYYNLYFPANSSTFQTSYFEQAPTTEWAQMLRNFYNAVTPKVWSGAGGASFHPPVAPNIRFTSQYPLPGTPLSIFTSATFGVELTGRNFAYADATFDRVLPDGTVVRYATERILTDGFDEQGAPVRENIWRNGVDTRRNFFWDVALPVVSDGINSFNEYIVETDDVAFMDGIYYDGVSGLPNEVSLIFSKPEGNQPGRVQRVISRTEGGNALAAINIPIGARFFSTKSVVTSDGRVVQELGNIYLWAEGGLTYTYQPAPSGTYNIGFLVTGYGGTTGFASRTVEVNNDGLNPDLRAGVRADAGFIITRPKDWSFLAIGSDGGFPYYRTASIDNTQNITGYFSFSPDAATDLSIIPADVLANYYGATWNGIFNEITIAGVPAIEVFYSYEDPLGVRGTLDGRGFALFNPYVGPGFGMLFSAEVVQGSGGNLEALYAQLKADFSLFSPAQIADDRLWDDSFFTRRQFFTEGVRYPLRVNWGSVVQGIWTRYSILNSEGVADENSPTFVAFTKVDAPPSADALLEQLVAQYASGDGFVRLANRTLNTPTLSWQAALYTVNRNGVAISGRIYVTIPEVGGPAYAAWVETPDGADANATYATILELMLDGFQIDE